mmetsp:Transcript_33468/g.76486  ORF Transcript_33468/g.76486 Transcript_33468/m.76486 type:complete len:308 (+) Transcript_33468:520-1443(+)
MRRVLHPHLHLVRSGLETLTVALDHARTMVVVFAPNVSVAADASRRAVLAVDAEHPPAGVAAARRVHPEIVVVLETNGGAGGLLVERESAPVDVAMITSVGGPVARAVGEALAEGLLFRHLLGLEGPANLVGVPPGVAVAVIPRGPCHVHLQAMPASREMLAVPGDLTWAVVVPGSHHIHVATNRTRGALATIDEELPATRAGRAVRVHADVVVVHEPDGRVRNRLGEVQRAPRNETVVTAVSRPVLGHKRRLGREQLGTASHGCTLACRPTGPTRSRRSTAANTRLAIPSWTTGGTPPTRATTLAR